MTGASRGCSSHPPGGSLSPSRWLLFFTRERPPGREQRPEFQPDGPSWGASAPGPRAPQGPCSLCTKGPREDVATSLFLFLLRKPQAALDGALGNYRLSSVLRSVQPCPQCSRCPHCLARSEVRLPCGSLEEPSPHQTRGPSWQTPPPSPQSLLPTGLLPTAPHCSGDKTLLPPGAAAAPPSCPRPWTFSRLPEHNGPSYQRASASAVLLESGLPRPLAVRATPHLQRRPRPPLPTTLFPSTAFVPRCPVLLLCPDVASSDTRLGSCPLSAVGLGRHPHPSRDVSLVPDT